MPARTRAPSPNAEIVSNERTCSQGRWVMRNAMTVTTIPTTAAIPSVLEAVFQPAAMARYALNQVTI